MLLQSKDGVRPATGRPARCYMVQLAPERRIDDQHGANRDLPRCGDVGGNWARITVGRWSSAVSSLTMLFGFIQCAILRLP